MPSARVRRLTMVLVLVSVLPMAGAASRPARAGDGTPRVTLAGPSAPGRHPIPARGPTGRRGEGPSEASGGWWLGTAAIALALALCGGISVATRRYLPQHAAGPLRVICRTSLSPKHTVYLLEAGRRVLIVGTGPQGPPSLLGDLTAPADLRPFAPEHPDPIVPRSDVPGPSATGSVGELGVDA